MSFNPTRIVLIRHGNTFRKGDTLLRVGKQTDLDLVESEKGKKAGQYINEKFSRFSRVYSGPLKRHTQTAKLICEEIGLDNSYITIDERLNELDYGVHDGRPESEVVAIVGKESLLKWDEEAIPPKEWSVDVESITNNLKSFLEQIEKKHQGKDTIVVTSNGILRFLPFAMDIGIPKVDLKVPTGGFVVIEKEQSMDWKIVEWGLKP